MKTVDLFDNIDNKVNLIRLNVTIEEWYIDEECTIPFDFNQKITNDLTLFAKLPNDNPNEDSTDNYPLANILLFIACGLVALGSSITVIYLMKKKRQ